MSHEELYFVGIPIVGPTSRMYLTAMYGKLIPELTGYSLGSQYSLKPGYVRGPYVLYDLPSS